MDAWLLIGGNPGACLMAAGLAELCCFRLMSRTYAFMHQSPQLQDSPNGLARTKTWAEPSSSAEVTEDRATGWMPALTGISVPKC